MDTVSHDAITRPASVDDAALVHALYIETPAYFDIISIPIPTADEVRRDLETAARDPRRYTELVLLPFGTEADCPTDPMTDRPVAGYLDYKLQYPDPNDATVNLLLVHSRLQSSGVGRRAVADLEHRLRGRTGRILASIYGQNPRAQRFWQSMGYHFAIDAKPILDWYAKEI